MRKHEALSLAVVGMLAFIAGCVAIQSEPVSQTPVVIAPVLQPVAAVNRHRVNKKDFECLRANLYFEARTESIRGMQAVAFVTLTRTENPHFPHTVCGVVYQRHQFSWTCDAKPDKPNLKNILERRAWDKASLVAREVLDGSVHNWLGNATHYHASYVHPRWAKANRFKELAQVGVHIFYKDTGLFKRA